MNCRVMPHASVSKMLGGSKVPAASRCTRDGWRTSKLPSLLAERGGRRGHHPRWLAHGGERCRCQVFDLTGVRQGVATGVANALYRTLAWLHP